MMNQRRLARVVLVGRPNVGKSTLFNRVAGSRRAIVAPMPGTTRDVIAQRVSWRDVEFELTDTGGMFGASRDPLHALVVQHGRNALASADVIVFLVDGPQGKVPGDEEIATELRPLGIPVVVAINKADDRRTAGSVVEFYRFGFEPVVEISAEHGLGVADLLDQIVGHLPGTSTAPEHVQAEVGVAIVGRPNVGKSSLVNRLLREERVLVSDMPGTTRDAVDAVLRWHRRSFRIVDTAGIRRPGRVAASGAVEATSVLVARRAIARADVAVLVVDAREGATDQDAAIAGEIQRAGRGIIIAVNKWDLVKGSGQEFVRTFDERIRYQLKFLDYAPVVHLSARTGERVERLLQLIDQVAVGRRKRVPTAELNRFVTAVTSAHPPASPGRKAVKILYATQTAIAPPTFVFFTNVATKFHFSYERFLENRLRESFGFAGSPLRIHVRRT
ncbi:MAG: ribosome biogenesis GTPase Der [Acidobacteria bacterium]|nr:ribosome biogenesis GTPase Der [Acidobacteriota bacterium]